MPSTLRLVVFDVGGVFRDSQRAMHRCFIEAFSKNGIDLQFDPSVAYHLRGLESFNNLLQATKALYITRGQGLDEYLNDPEGEERLNALIERKERAGEVDGELVTRVRDQYQTLFGSDEAKELISMYDGAEESVKLLRERNYTLGVLSNGSLKALKRDLGHLFDHFAFAMAEANKPNPTKYLQALRSANVEPHQTAYVGDAVSDVVMAKQAGSISVALLCGMGTECHLRAAEPDHIFSSLKEFADCLVELGTQSEPCEGEGGARALIKKGTLIPEREEKPWGIRHKQGVDQ
jgi:HAD superfamily hydrolase (TIGR01549 family)